MMLSSEREFTAFLTRVHPLQVEYERPARSSQQLAVVEYDLETERCRELNACSRRELKAKRDARDDRYEFTGNQLEIAMRVLEKGRKK